LEVVISTTLQKNGGNDTEGEHPGSDNG
jgi:hypothetical protein